jgi:DNA (cytosine-5)-methyltransferase 1
MLPLTYVDLFCGIGSFHQSFKQKGWECVLACDIDESTHSVYRANHGMTPRRDIYDIRDDEIPEHDVLCAGFPCQAFSRVGKNLGFEDNRGVLFLEVIRFARARRPKILALENVRGILSHDEGRTFATIVELLEAEGYTVHHKLLTASDYGIPQMRKRVIFLCVRNDVQHEFTGDAILDFSAYMNPNVCMKDYLGRNYEKKYAYTIRCGGRRSPIESRKNWEAYWVDGQVHRLTLDEVKKLQGFPDEFRLSEKTAKAWHHLGNTIPTVFTKLLAERISEMLA